MHAPCYGCKRRRVGCHADCEEYKAYNAEREAIRARRTQDRIINGVTNQTMKRYKDRRAKQKRAGYTGGQ